MQNTQSQTSTNIQDDNFLPQAQKRIQKLINFSPRLYDNALLKAKMFGFSFSDYVKFLIANDVKSQVEKTEFLGKEEEESVARGIEDYKNKQGFLAKNSKDLDKHFDSLT